MAKHNPNDIEKLHDITLNNLYLLNDYECNNQVDYQLYTDRTQEQIENCNEYYNLLHLTSDKTELYKRTPFSSCKKNICLLCEQKKADKWFWKIKNKIESDKAQNKDLNLYFLTLTIPNKNNDFNNQTLKLFSKMWATFRHNKFIKELLNKNYIRKLEITINFKEKSYHPHFHILFKLNEPIKSLNTIKNLISMVWTESYCKMFKTTRDTINTKDKLLLIDLQKAKFDKIYNELTAYVCKDMLGSWEKEDLLDEIEKKIKHFKSKGEKSKVKHFKEQYKAIEQLTQYEITQLFRTFIDSLYNIRIFTLSWTSKLVANININDIRTIRNQFNFDYYKKFTINCAVKEDYSEEQYLIQLIQFKASKVLNKYHKTKDESLNIKEDFNKFYKLILEPIWIDLPFNDTKLKILINNISLDFELFIRTKGI